MTLKYNPLLSGKLDQVGAGADKLDDLEDVNTAGTVDGYVLSYEAASGTWKPAAGGAGDMLKSDYDTTDNGTVDNSERLENNTLASVRDHNVAAGKITSGTITLARIPGIDDGRIPDLETLSYGGTFADAQIPDIETLSYGAAFATTQIPNLGASKIASGTLNADRIPVLPTSRYGSAILKDGSRELTSDWDIGDGRMIQTDKIRARDAAGLKLYEDGGAGIFIENGGDVGIGTTGPSAKLHVVKNAVTNKDVSSYAALLVEDTEGLLQFIAADTDSYAGGLILTASPTSGTSKHWGLLSKGPSVDNRFAIGYYAGMSEPLTSIVEHLTILKGGDIGIGVVPTAKLDVNGNAKIGGTLDMNSHIIKNLTDPTAAQHAASKNFVDAHVWAANDITEGTLAVARHETLNNLNGTVDLVQIPTMDDGHIPNLEGLSYGAAFATTQIPNLGASKIASGTLNADRIPVLPTSRYGSAVLLSGAQTIGGTKTFGDIPILPASDPTADNEAARKAYVDAQGGGGGGTLCELSDVSCAGTVDGYVLTFEAASGTWKPAAGGAGDMLKSDYDTTDNGTVDNSERLENNTLASVRDHNVAAAKITSGTLAVARHQTLNNLNGTVDLVQIPTMDDGHIPSLETLTGGAFATAQIPSIGAYKITSGTLGVARHETLDNLNGTIDLDQVPTMDDGHIPNIEGLSYGAAFATTQIPNLPTSKITSGTLAVARHQTINNLNGTIDLVQIPTMDDGHIPNLEGLSYGGAFATTQIPNLPTSKITSGSFNADRIPILPTSRYGSAVLVSGTRSMTGDLDFAKHQAKAMAFEVLGSAPASPATAQMYYNTSTDKVMIYVV